MFIHLRFYSKVENENMYVFITEIGIFIQIKISYSSFFYFETQTVDLHCKTVYFTYRISISIVKLRINM